MFRNRVRRSTIRAFERLESKRLLAASIDYISGGLPGELFDFVGDTSSVGPDGYLDSSITIISLPAKDVASVRVEAIKFVNGVSTVNYTWAYGANSNAYPLAEFIRDSPHPLSSDYPVMIDVSTGTNADSTASIFISPAPSGTDFNRIKVTITYADSSIDDPWQNVDPSGTQSYLKTKTVFPLSGPELNGLPSPRLAVTGNDIPQYQAGFAVLESSQYTGTSDSIKRYGDMHIKLLSLPSEKSFSDIAKMYLDDGTGSANTYGDIDEQMQGSTVWSNDSTRGRYRLGFEAASDSSYKADIYAKPIRNVVDSKLTLVVELSNGSKFYTQFSGKTIDPTLSESNGVGWMNGTAQVYYVQPDSSPSFVRYSTSKSTLSTGTVTSLYELLRANSSGPIPNGSRIIFTPGEYHVTQVAGSFALMIDRPISLEGESGAILKFQAETLVDNNAWRTYDSSLKIQSSHVRIRDLTLDFPNEIQYKFPSESIVDYENVSAIRISTPNYSSQTTHQDQLVNVNLTNLTILGPKASGKTESERNSIPSDSRGKTTQFLITTDFASGTISDNVIVGGSIQLRLGPWTVTGNDYRGPKRTNLVYTSGTGYQGISLANTPVPSYVDDVFRLVSPRDVIISGNQASIPIPETGVRPTVNRFIAINNVLGASHHLVIENNTIGSGIGRRFEENVSGLAGPAVDRFINPPNQPEIILNETYDIAYEGITLNLDSDRRILQIPSADTSRRGRPIMAGDIVAILKGTNAGEYRVVSQVLKQVNASSTVLLLQDPMPDGSPNFVVSVSRGMTDTRIVKNRIDLTGTTSVGIAMTGNQFGLEIRGNTIRSDQTFVVQGGNDVQMPIAIRIEAYNNEISRSNAGYSATYPVPTKDWTRNPIFALSVVDNIIEKVLGGIKIDVKRADPSSSATTSIGRTYISGVVSDNTFTEYSSDEQTAPLTGYVRSVSTTRLITIGDVSWKSTGSSAPYSETFEYGSANLNLSDLVIKNSASPNSYLPNSGSGGTYFADPYAIRLTMANNVLDRNGATSAINKKMIVAAGVINNDAIVISDTLGMTNLPYAENRSDSDYFMNDSDFGFSTSGSSLWNYWPKSSPSSGFRNDHTTTSGSGSTSTISASATWNFADIVPGQYEVYVSWPQDSTRATDVPFTIMDGTKPLAIYRVNQQQAPNVYDSLPSYGIGWRRLGDVFQIDSTSLSVLLQNNVSSTGTIAADGVWIRRVADVIIDDHTDGFSTSGSWTNYARFDEKGYRHDHSAIATVGTSNSATGIATWNFDDITPGEYEVWVTWYPTSNRAVNAPFKIKNGSTTLGTIRIDQTKQVNDNTYGVSEEFDGTQWRKLGSRYTIDGNGLVVELSNNADNSGAPRYVVADAVRIKRVADTIVNERDAEFTATNITGSYTSGWELFSGDTIAGYNKGHYGVRVASTSGAATSTAKWTFNDLLPGLYEVLVTWPGDSSRTQYAPFKVSDGTNERFTDTVDQRSSPATGNAYGGVEWKKLNSIATIVSSTLVVELSNVTSETGTQTVVADGVRIRRISSLLIDDGDIEFTTSASGSDQWNYGGNTTSQDFGNDQMWIQKSTSSTGSIGYAEWKFMGLPSGSYDVYVSWVPGADRAQQVKYYGNGTYIDYVDQQNQPYAELDAKQIGGQYFVRLSSSATPNGSGNLTIRMETDTSALNKYFIADAVHIRPASLLQSSGEASGNGTVGDNLAGVVPDASVTEAIRRWSETGLSQERIDRLKSVQVTTADFGAGTLGSTDGDTIFIDRDGDSRGWYIDPTPTDDAEFVPGSAITPAGFDLLTVLMHEFGHILGYGDLEPGTGDLMTESIGTGIRRNPNGYVAEPPVEVVTPIPVSRPVSNRSARLLRAVDRLDRRERKFAQLKLRSQAQPARDAAISNSLARIATQRARLIRNMH